MKQKRHLIHQLTSLLATQKQVKNNSGFTMVELLIIIIIIGIFTAILTPSWLGFLNRQRLRTAQDQVYWAMQTAKTEAKQTKEIRQISFRDQNNKVEWVVHQKDVIPTENEWTSLDKAVQIDTTETTLYKNKSTQIWRMQFNHRGHANGQLGRVTLSLRKGDKGKRCVFVSTLIGTLRKAQDRPKKASDGKSCY